MGSRTWIFFPFATMSLARSKGTLVGRRALAGTILGVSTYFILSHIVPTVFFFFGFFKFQKLSALRQKPTGLSMLSSNLAKLSLEPSLQ